MFLTPFFMSWTQRSKTFYMFTKAYFSQILFTNLSKSVLVSTFLCRDNPSTSQMWHIKMLIRQHDDFTGFHRLATIKGHSKMCSCTVLGGGGTSQYLMWPPFASCSATHLISHRVDQVVDCGLWNTPELEHAVVYANPEHPKHVQWVTCQMGMLAMQELGCIQLPWIVYKFL